MSETLHVRCGVDIHSSVQYSSSLAISKNPLHTINQNVCSGFFGVNYFRMDDMKRKIVRTVLIFAGALFVGIFAAVVMEYVQAGRENTSHQSRLEQETQTSLQTHWEREEKIFIQLQANDGNTPTRKTQMDEELKKVALTFDDGPNADYTGMLLDGLKERGVKATFFVLGSEVELYPQLVRRASDEGHLIGVHAYRHVNLRQLSDTQAIEQVDRTNGAIYRATGQYASYIRPPYGCWKDDLDYEVQMVEVLWDIDPRDWATTSSDLVVQRVLKEVEENSIILLHDASKSSVQAAFSIIDALQKQGYTFVTVEELLME